MRGPGGTAQWGPERPWNPLEPSGRSLPLKCEQVASAVTGVGSGLSPDRAGLRAGQAASQRRLLRQLGLTVPVS